MIEIYNKRTHSATDNEKFETFVDETEYQRKDTIKTYKREGDNLKYSLIS